MKWIVSVALGAAISAQSPAGTKSLDGVWTFSTLTPLERPAEFAGKAAFTPEEAAAFEKRTMERNDRDRRDPASADADLGGAYNEFWWERGTHVAKVRGKLLTSLIVDPPDGRVPPLTREAQIAAQARANDRRQHPADGPENRSLGERCLMFNAGPPMLPGPYNNYVQILDMGRAVVILNEMIHDARIVSLDGGPHPPSAIRRWQGDSRPLGRKHARGRHHELHRQNELQGVRRTAAPRRTLHARRRRHAALRVHRRRPHDVHASLVGGVADDENRRAAARVRVPRGQLRADRHPERGAGGREAVTGRNCRMAEIAGWQNCRMAESEGGKGQKGSREGRK